MKNDKKQNQYGKHIDSHKIEIWHSVNAKCYHNQNQVVAHNSQRPSLHAQMSNTFVLILLTLKGIQQQADSKTYHNKFIKTILHPHLG